MEDEGLSFKTDVVGGSIVVQVVGELDLATERPFVDHFAAQPDGEEPIDIDLTGVPFIDSRGLNTLVRTVERLRERGIEAKIVNVAPQGLELLEMTGLREQLMRAGDAGP